MVAFFGSFGILISIILFVITYVEDILIGDVALKTAALKDGNHDPYREFNEFINSYFYSSFGLLALRASIINRFGIRIGYYIATYIRDFFLGSLVYWMTAGLWHIAIYHFRGHELFTKKGRPFPTWDIMLDQMFMAQSSLFLYAGLPVLSEFLIESKMTKVYFYLDEIGGLQRYTVYFVLYIAFVELGIYWVHRTLHTNKLLYKYIHGPHHKYNKSTTLTPWASIAFHPIDGLLQVRSCIK